MSKSIFYLSLCHSDSDIAPKFGQNPFLSSFYLHLYTFGYTVHRINQLVGVENSVDKKFSTLIIDSMFQKFSVMNVKY